MNAIKSCPTGFIYVNGLSPSGSGECQFKVEEKHVEHFWENGPISKYYEVHSVCELLKNPDIVFQGLKREGHAASFCYVGKPKIYGEDYAGDPWLNMVFLVCITEDFTFFEWRWEKEDGEKELQPA